MLVKLFTIFVGNVILSSMKFGTILLVVYIVCVVSWILIISLQKNVKNKQELVFSYFPQFLTFSPAIGPTATREGTQTARETLQNGQNHQG